MIEQDFRYFSQDLFG